MVDSRAPEKLRQQEGVSPAPRPKRRASEKSLGGDRGLPQAENTLTHTPPQSLARVLAGMAGPKHSSMATFRARGMGEADSEQRYAHVR